jgi:hypothetical protein
LLERLLLEEALRELAELAELAEPAECVTTFVLWSGR